MCFDVSNACNGFMSGLYLADCMIASGRIETALVVTGEKPSKVMYEIMDLIKDCDNAEYFRKKLGVLTVGDSGGSMVLAKSDNGIGFQKFNSISDGKLAELCYYRYDEKGIIDGQMIMKDIGREVFNYQSKLIDKTYEILGWTPADVDHLISHQIGRKPFEMTAKLTGIPIEKATKTYDYYGNLTSATIPVNLFLNPPKTGDKLLLMGMGSGLSVIQAGLTF
jgi:3-oxoacyl-[acyl-carrier-protein] synthase-3